MRKSAEVVVEENRRTESKFASRAREGLCGDCSIYVKSRRAGERVLENTVKFIEETLKLRVNRDKSGVFRPRRAKFLGCAFVGTAGAPRVRPKSSKRLRLKLRDVFRQARGSSLLRMIEKLGELLSG